MAELDIDAEASVGDLHLEALFALGAEVQGLRGDLAKLLKLEQEYERKGPVFVALQGGATSDSASDPLVIDLGGPAALRAWEVRQLVIGGLLWSSTVAGNALAIVSSATPMPLQVPGLASIQDQAPSLPSIAFYSAGQFRLRHPNHLFIVILSPTATTPYTVGGDAFDLPDVAERATFTQ
jgi:hypothetical protein